ncbi:MAG: permease-like cell division protein FtsX [Bacteroidales bacterium]|nr:permease-like cell division protein FtsX [Candidatus Cryptobacteroides caccocaballi]
MAEKDNIIGKRLVNAYLSSVISISLVLFLVGVASLLLVNARSVSNYFKENMKVSVMLKQNVSESKSFDYLESLSDMRFIKSADYISREQGIREMKELLGDDFLDVFEAAPIPISIDVTLKADYVSADSLEMVKLELLESPVVDEVVYQRSLVDALNQNISRISLVMAVMIGLLLFISFVLISNTMRLSVYARRFNIHTMQLVGATPAFIRGPFLLQGLLQGIFSAMIAILMLLGGLFAIRSSFAQMFEIFRLPLLLVVMGIVLATGIVICVVSTYFVVGKLISMRRTELYY